MNTPPRSWIKLHILPPVDDAVEVRFVDGSSDYLLWTGADWFPRHPGKTVIAWRALPTGDGCEAIAS